jgi:hypothetical protein
MVVQAVVRVLTAQSELVHLVKETMVDWEHLRQIQITVAAAVVVLAVTAVLQQAAQAAMGVLVQLRALTELRQYALGAVLVVDLITWVQEQVVHKVQETEQARAQTRAAVVMVVLKVEQIHAVQAVQVL